MPLHDATYERAEGSSAQHRIILYDALTLV